MTPEEITQLETIISTAASGHTVYKLDLPIHLAWDEASPFVKEFEVFIKQRYGFPFWMNLDNNTTQNSVTIDVIPEYLPIVAGSYELGVRSVSYYGTESPMHISLDDTADPVNGLYMIFGRDAFGDANGDGVVSTPELLSYMTSLDVLNRGLDNLSTTEKEQLEEACDMWYSGKGDYIDWQS